MKPEDQSWEVEVLLRKAFLRVKERFLTYILAYVLMTVVLFAAIILFTLIVGFSIGLFAHKMTLIIGVLLAGLAVLAVIAFMYLASYMQLVAVYTLIRKDKGTVMQNIREVKDMVWGYVWFSIASSVFILGLLPVGLLSIFVIFILWAIWGSFASFIYIEYRMKGLDNLWASYMMIKQRFWGIAGRMAILVGSYMLLSTLLSLDDNAVLSVLQFILSILFGPFIMSYDYEIYRLLKLPDKVQRPGIWIATSIIGYVIITLVIVYIGQNLGEAGPRIREMLKENTRNEDLNKNYEEFPVLRGGVTMSQQSYA